MLNFGEVKYLELRNMWANEAREFTPWLAKNIQDLGKTLGMDLEIIEREASVGNFSLDLLAKDLGTGHNVIIENQFGITDHDHLGKLMTYAAGFNASSIIWIAEEFREEHRSALEWLNQRTSTETSFFGVIVEVFQIDDSKPAYRFRPIISPNGWEKAKRPVSNNQISPRAEAYRRYFQILIDELRETHKFTGARIAQPQNWYSFASGLPGISYETSFVQGNKVGVQVYLDKGNQLATKQFFDELAVNSRQQIEDEFGESLVWERLDHRRASRIAIYRDGSIENNEDTLTEIRKWVIERLLKFKKVFSAQLQPYRNHTR